MGITAAILTALVLATSGERWITSFSGDTMVTKDGAGGTPAVRAALIALPEHPPSPLERCREIAPRFAQGAFGVAWPRWLATTEHSNCEPYHGSDLSSEEVYWVFRCREPSAIGRIETECFLLDQDSIPTVERTRWSAGASSGLRRAHADTLARSLGAALGENVRFVRREVLTAWIGPWMLVAELSTPFGRLRLYQGAASDPALRDSLILEHTSRRLGDALARAESGESPYDPERWAGDTLGPARQRAEAAGALEVSSSRLSQALRRHPSRPEDAGAVVDAIDAARRAPASARNDAVLWGAHLWVTGLAIDTDTAAERSVAAMLEPHGIHRVEMPDSWCWEDSIPERLALRAGQDLWTDRAFLELMRRGWERPCAPCGNDEPYGPDEFKPTIARGEDFLRRHPRSPVAREVRWLVAEAHETAWSLSKASGDGEYVDPARYVIDAPEHRTRAIEMYRSLLKDEPPGRRRTTATNRLRRLLLDVDTGYQPFWCMWD